MLKRSLALLTIVSASLCPVAAAPFASAVVQYTAGSGSASGYNNPLSALGEPSRITPGMFGGPVDPFNPAFQSSQLVSLGSGGSITLALAEPAVNAPDHAFGLDFILFGNNGFTIVNGDFSGGGITDGSTFTFDPPGASRIFVSDDNLAFYELVAPLGRIAVADGLFPTDGSGNFQTPVDPTLRNSDFSNLDLMGIRGLYAGSAGGTGFDLAWAQTSSGQPFDLAQARYVRVDVLNGKLEIDGLAVVPEPGTVVLGCLALAVLAVSRKIKRSASGSRPVYPAGVGGARAVPARSTMAWPADWWSGAIAPSNPLRPGTGRAPSVRTKV